MGLTKAWIMNEDSQEKIECLFNPNEYTISKSNRWVRKSAAGRNVPNLAFAGGESRQLSLKLFFDVYEKGGDVRVYIDKLWQLAMVDESTQNSETQRARPPLCTFQWGPNWSFRAVITSLSVQYTLFRADGTPVRATASLTLQEAQDASVDASATQSSSDSSGSSYTVQPNDTLQQISYQVYGDSDSWRTLADANSILDPNDLTPGQTLNVPPK